MLQWFKDRAAIRDSALQLYGSSVTQARHETFYAAWNVPDTPEGRYEMIVIHLFLLVSRLQREGPDGQRLSQALMEAFVADMDDNMREMGVGDLKVPKRVKKAAAGAFDRIADYRAAFEQDKQGPLLDVLQRHIYGGGPRCEPARAMAKYMCDTIDVLDSAVLDDLMAGKAAFPAPDVA